MSGFISPTGRSGWPLLHPAGSRRRSGKRGVHRAQYAFRTPPLKFLSGGRLGTSVGAKYETVAEPPEAARQAPAGAQES